MKLLRENTSIADLVPVLCSFGATNRCAQYITTRLFNDGIRTVGDFQNTSPDRLSRIPRINGPLYQPYLDKLADHIKDVKLFPATGNESHA